MTYEVQPLPFKPHRLEGLSERLIVSHYVNNYGGAVRRLNAIESRLDEAGAQAPGFILNGLGRERLLAANSMTLHEIYFEGLGGSGPAEGLLAEALARDFGSLDRWKAEFVASGRALAGGSGWILTQWSPRLGRLVNQWAPDHGHGLADGVPVLALDMYEHAYALDFGADVASYVDRFMANLHWPRIEARWLSATGQLPTLADGGEEASITVCELARLLKGPDAPVLLDVCLPEDMHSRNDRIPGALFVRPDKVGAAAAELPLGRPVVVYCIYGFQVSGEATAALRRRGFAARRLTGGLAAWRAMGGALDPLPERHTGEAA